MAEVDRRGDGNQLPHVYLPAASEQQERHRGTHAIGYCGHLWVAGIGADRLQGTHQVLVDVIIEREIRVGFVGNAPVDEVDVEARISEACDVRDAGFDVYLIDWGVPNEA